MMIRVRRARAARLVQDGNNQCTPARLASRLSGQKMKEGPYVGPSAFRP
jgi:hypothetical protein